jgi:hypothetical protein
VSIECTHAGTRALYMWECTDYIQNYLRYILKQNLNFLKMFIIFLNVGSQNPTIIFWTSCTKCYEAEEFSFVKITYKNGYKVTVSHFKHHI